MAKRKAKKTYRRRRVGGIGKLNAGNPIVKFGSLAAGYFLADKINPQIDKVAGEIDGKIVAGLQTFAGLVANGMVPIGKKKARSMPLVIVGGVLAGSGIKRGLSEFGVMNGFHNVPVLSGYRQVPALNGYNPTPGTNLGGYKVPSTSNLMGSVPDMEGAEGGSGINPTDR